jgi:hypothetical protein
MHSSTQRPDGWLSLAAPAQLATRSKWCLSCYTADTNAVGAGPLLVLVLLLQMPLQKSAAAAAHAD